MTYEDGRRDAMLQMADECDRGVKDLREKYTSAFPDGDFDYIIRTVVTANAFQKIAQQLRGDAERLGK